MNALKFKPEGWNNEITKIDNINNFMGEDKVLQGLVKSCDSNYNLYVNLDNGNLPKEKICTGKVNKFIQFKIKKVKDEKSVIISRKEVQQDALQWVKNDLKVGDKVDGIVKSIKNYGAFIEIGGGIVGLAHIEDLSVARIQTPYERLKIGQKLNIMVKSIDKDKGKVILSYKELLGSWEENVREFTQGMKTQGIVRETEKNKNGIFIELKPNLVGMAEYQEGLEYGKKVKVYIRKIDKEKKKVKLDIID